MKIQEVILRAMAKTVTWWQAAEMIGDHGPVLGRHREYGYDGLWDRRPRTAGGGRYLRRVLAKVVKFIPGVYWDHGHSQQVDQLHSPRAQLRARARLLGLQNSNEGAPCREEAWCGIKATTKHKSTKQKRTRSRLVG